MEEKEKSKVTPLQQAKKDKIDELTEKDPDAGTGDEKRPGVKKGEKRGGYKPKVKPIRKTKEPPSEPVYTLEMAEKDASFLSTFVNSFRNQAGIGPIHPDHQVVFEHSASQLYMKYGPSAARWMPEVMFAGSLFVILIDSATQIKKLKATQKADPREKNKAIEAEVIADNRDHIPPGMNLAGTPDMSAGSN